MVWPDGRKYVGGWAYGKQHGEGTFTDLMGTTKKGNYRSGKKFIRKSKKTKKDD